MHILKSIVKKMGYLVALIIILIAICIIIGRLLTPTLEKHRSDFEKMATQLLGMPVRISQTHISWYQYRPEVSLDRVTILDAESKKPILNIQQISIFISIPQSIWHLRFVPSGIMIQGADISIRKTEHGDYTLEGFPNKANNQVEQSASPEKAAIQWLSEQPRFILRDIMLHYVDPHQTARNVTVSQLDFQNKDEQHKISGKMILQQSVPMKLTFTFNWQGKELNLANLQATSYLSISHLSLLDPALLEWLSFPTLGLQLKDGMISGKLWMSWDQGVLQKVQTSLEVSNVNLYSSIKKTTQPIRFFSGDFGWMREGKKETLVGEEILIDLASSVWPITHFYLSLEQDEQNNLIPKNINIGYLNLNDVGNFLLSSFSLFPEETQNKLAKLKLQGSLQDVNMKLSMLPMNSGLSKIDWQHSTFKAAFSHLSFLPIESFPGIENLTGMIHWDGVQGGLDLNSYRTLFQYDAIFSRVLNLNQLSGHVFLQKDQNNWVIKTDLQLLNPDIALNTQGTVSIPSDATFALDLASIDLNANFTLHQITRITHYLPMKMFDKDLSNWLSKAFLSGEVESGQLKIRGKLSEFPFDQQNGIFQISGVLKNINFNYAPNWPMMRNTDGKIMFSGRKIAIDIDHSFILGIPLNEVHGEIPAISNDQPTILNVQKKDIQTNFKNAMNFVQMSPLKSTIGKMFTGVKMDGPLLLTLGLKIPLENPERAEVNGLLDIKEATIKVVPWKLQLDRFNGQLQFTEKSATANGLTAELFSHPLQLNVSTEIKSKDLSVIKVNFTHHLYVNDIENWLKIPFSSVLSGSTDVTGEIDFSTQEPPKILLQSNLVGIKIDLPDDYGKKAIAEQNFLMNVIVNPNHPLKIKLDYGNLFSTALILDHQYDQYQLNALTVRLGRGDADWPSGRGLYVTGDFDKLSWDKIKNYTSSNQIGLVKLPLKSVDIRAKQFNWMGQVLNNFRVQAIPGQTNWKISIASSEVTGDLQIPNVLNKKGLIVVELQNLDLKTSTTNKTMEIDVNSLPAISFSANQVRYNNISFGKMTFKTSPTNRGLSIQDLKIISDRMRLDAFGEWVKEKQSNTYLQGRATSSKVSVLLNSFGFDVHNVVASKGEVNFNLNWQDAPFAPALMSLNGKATLDLGPGRVLDVGQDSSAKMDLGKMLSIFSLQSIPRRLTFDFSDLFQKGYSFDSVRGDFNFKNGNAYTSNLRFDGPIARVAIDGRIGIHQKDYDFALVITPYVTSGLPVAAAFVGGPWIGLAAFAVNSVIGSKISTYYYSVTGTWDNPVWKSVKVSKGQ